jgi:hypothetical protein
MEVRLMEEVTTQICPKFIRDVKLKVAVVTKITEITNLHDFLYRPAKTVTLDRGVRNLLNGDRLTMWIIHNTYPILFVACKSGNLRRFREKVE